MEYTRYVAGCMLLNCMAFDLQAVYHVALESAHGTGEPSVPIPSQLMRSPHKPSRPVQARRLRTTTSTLTSSRSAQTSSSRWCSSLSRGWSSASSRTLTRCALWLCFVPLGLGRRGGGAEGRLRRWCLDQVEMFRWFDRMRADGIDICGLTFGEGVIKFISGISGANFVDSSSLSILLILVPQVCHPRCQTCLGGHSVPSVRRPRS